MLITDRTRNPSGQGPAASHSGGTSAGFPRGRTVLAAHSPRRPTHPALDLSARPSSGPEPGDPRPGSRHRAALRRFELRGTGNTKLGAGGAAQGPPPVGMPVCLCHRGAPVPPCPPEGAHVPLGVPVPPVRSRCPRIHVRMPVSPWECRCPRGGRDVSVGVAVPPVGAAGVCPPPRPRRHGHRPPGAALTARGVL